jgi:Rod binding domain-containing protein
MSPATLPLLASVSPGVRHDTPAKIRDAAHQFEALLIGQLLHSAREGGSGWLGSPGDASSDCATSYAEQQLAAAMAGAGGLGIANLIQRGLTEPEQRQANSLRSPGSEHPGIPAGNTGHGP